MHGVQSKKTECLSTLKLTVKVPTKREKLTAHKQPFLLTHPTVLSISFTHNHPLQSAHALSFRPISATTKQMIFKYFSKGHSASSAHHWHETKLLLDHGEDQTILADRKILPNLTFTACMMSGKKRSLGQIKVNQCLSK